MNAEGTALALRVEAEIEPEAGGLDQHLRTLVEHQGLVVGDLDIFAQGVEDIGVDVILGRPRGVVGRGLLAVDGAPGEQRPHLVDHLRALPGLVQHTVAKTQQVAGHARSGVGQKRQDIDLGVPEVVPLVGLAGQSLGGDAGPFCAPRRLQDLEQVPAQRLLHLLGGARRILRIPLDLDVAAQPEVVQVGALLFDELAEALLDRPVQGPSTARYQLRGRRGARGVIGDELVDHPPLVLGAVDRFAVIASGFNPVIDPAGQVHPAVARPVSKQDAPLATGVFLRHHDLVAEALALARILHARLIRPVAEHVRSDHHRRLGIEHGDGIGDGGHVALGEGDQPPRFDQHPLAGSGLPENLAIEGARLHVEGTFVDLQAGGGQKKRFVVDVETHRLGIGDVDHSLAGLGKAEGVFPVDNGPGFVKTVDEGAVLERRARLLEIAAHPQVAVADGENRLGLGEKTGVEGGLDDLPVVEGIDVLRRVQGLVTDHSGRSPWGSGWEICAMACQEISRNLARFKVRRIFVTVQHGVATPMSRDTFRHPWRQTPLSWELRPHAG